MRLIAAILLFSIPLFSFSQDFQIYNGDTINRIDVNGRKQGHWKFFAKDKQGLKGYRPDQIYEQGDYRDSRKHGIWLRYYPNEMIKSEISYRYNRPNGPYILRNEKGEITEEGIWPKKHSSPFKPPYDPGIKEVKTFVYDTSNYKQGELIIYTPGGQPKGKPNVLEQWHDESGQVIFHRTYNNGRPVLNYSRHREIYNLRYDVNNVADSIARAATAYPLHSFELYKGDTINRKDANGKKQGPWHIFGKSRTHSGYPPEAIIEDGIYQNNRRIGVWFKYYQNGRLKARIQYKNGRANGIYVTFYQNGNIEEEGEWNRNRNNGCFLRYFENGCLQLERYIDAAGKPERSFYYQEDCNKPSDLRGTLKLSSVAGVVTYPKPEPIIDPRPLRPPYPIPPKKTPPCEGYQKRYDNNKQIEFDGEFRRCKLWNGKWYKYDTNGLLIKVEIYKNGTYAGDGVIEE
jgi:antitoxin component YwqK of YwqJK toxin-antitoxin module